MKRPILLIGAGRMGGALLKGWIATGIGPIAVVEPKPSPETRKLAAAHRFEVYEDVHSRHAAAQACVVALKPQVLRTEAGRFRAVAASGALMISIAAGTRTRFLSGAWGGEARIVRAMPNTPGAVGHGISALYAASGTTTQDRKLSETLLSALGETLWVSRESLIDSVTAVSGSGPAYVFLLVEALAAAARAEGLPKADAERLARTTVAGAGALLDADQRPATDLRKDVTSPGGTTEAALDILLGADGLKPLMARAVHAARKRAEELAR